MSRLTAPNLGIPSLGQRGGGPARHSELGASLAYGGGPTGYGATGGISGTPMGDRRDTLGAGELSQNARWDSMPAQTFLNRPSTSVELQGRRSQVDQHLAAGLGSFGGTRHSLSAPRQSSGHAFAQHSSHPGRMDDGSPASSESFDAASEASDFAPSQASASSARTGGSGRMGGAESEGSDYTPWPPPRHSTRPSAAGAADRLPRQSTRPSTVAPGQSPLQGRSNSVFEPDRAQNSDGRLGAGGYQRPSVARQQQPDFGKGHHSSWSRQSLAAQPYAHESEHVAVPAPAAQQQPCDAGWSRQSLAAQPYAHESEQVVVPALAAQQKPYAEGWSRQSLAAQPYAHESEQVIVQAPAAQQQPYADDPARPSVIANGGSGPCMSENGQGMMEVNLIDDDEESPPHGQPTTLVPPSSWTSPAATTPAFLDGPAKSAPGAESFNVNASNYGGSAVMNPRQSVMAGDVQQRPSFHFERQPYYDEAQFRHGLQETVQDNAHPNASLTTSEIPERAGQRPYYDQQLPSGEWHQEFHDTRQSCPPDMRPRGTVGTDQEYLSNQGQHAFPPEVGSQEQRNADTALVSRRSLREPIHSESSMSAPTSLPMPFVDRSDRTLERGTYEQVPNPRQHGAHHDAAMAAASAAMAVAPQPGAMAAFASSRPRQSGSAGSGPGLTQALSSYGPPSEWWHDSIILGRLSALALRYCATKSMRRPWLGWKTYVSRRREKMMTMLMFAKRVALKTWRWRALTKGRYKHKLPLVRVLAQLPRIILRPAWARMRQAVFMRRDLSRRLALLHLIERRMLDQIAHSHYYHRLLRLGLASLWLATQINPSNDKPQTAATPRTEAPRSHVEQVVRRVWRRWHFATNMWLSSAEYRVRETEAWLAGECGTPRAITTTSAAHAPLTPASPEAHHAYAWGDMGQSSTAGVQFDSVHFDPRVEHERGGIGFEAPIDMSFLGEAPSSLELPFPEAQEANSLGLVHLSTHGQQHASLRSAVKGRPSPGPRQVALQNEDQVTEPPQRTPPRPSPGPSHTSSASSFDGPQGGVPQGVGPHGGARGFGASKPVRKSNRGSVDEFVFVDPEFSDGDPADVMQGTSDSSMKVMSGGPPIARAASGGPSRRPAPVADLNDDYRSLRRSIAPRGPPAGRQVSLRQR